MSRLVLTLSLLAALLPSLAHADSGSLKRTPVRVLKGASPYRQPHWLTFPPPHVPMAMAYRFGRVVPPAPLTPSPRAPDLAALASARACKIFDRNGDGIGGPDEPLVEGWRFRLSHPERASRVRATGWDGCATFTGLRPGRYSLSEELPPFWAAPRNAAQEIDVAAPGASGGPPAATLTPVWSSGGCVHFAHMGSTEYWRGPAGLRLLDDRDRRLINRLEPFRAPSGAFTKGDEPFDGRFSDGRRKVRSVFDAEGAWGSGTWEAELALYLGDRGVRADPRGRLAQELLVFTLNARHFLEHAQVILIEDVPVFVDDLIFEGALAWRSDSPSWNHEVTALLAALNGTRGLPYVPRDQCQVAYLPF
ncbi:MAG: hypothetical protein WCC48_12345 [Anaeromyxobacteraceae bacterium]